MRVPTDSFTNTLIQQIQTLNTQQSTLEQQLASGQMITNPSDNPTAMGNVMNMSAQMEQLQQLSSNNATATSITQQSYTALSSMKDISVSASELATEGSSGTTSPSSNAAYATQVNQLIEQALQTANTQYNGAYLFGGTQTSTPPFTGSRDANGNVSGVGYNGTASGAVIPTGQGSQVSPYTSGTTNQGMADLINNLVTLRDALTNNDTTTAASVQTNLQTNEDNLLDAVSGVGAVQSGLEADETQNQATFTSLQTLVSKATSTDVATATVQLSQAQTSYQAALESSAKIMQTSLLNYLV
jgi:flagellar hook-associated protein 3 FlgL